MRNWALWSRLRDIPCNQLHGDTQLLITHYSLLITYSSLLYPLPLSVQVLARI